MEKNIKSILGFIIVISLISSFKPSGRLLTSEYSGSTTVETCNCVGTVQVRALSMGPGGCSVQFITSQGRKGIIAAPGVWSGWIDVYSYTAKLNVSVSNDVLCDTGVRTQIRYYGD